MIEETLSRFVPLFLITFTISLLTIPFWIKRAKQAGLIGKDIHKVKDIKIAEMGGVPVLFSFIIGVMIYIAMRIFILSSNTQIATLLAILTAVLLAGIIGILDDILGWKIGLKQWQKPLLTLIVAMPIMAVNAGNKMMHIPFLGETNLGIIYPLFIIPIFILVGTNGFNMLAGYNGLESGQGIIILSALAYLSYLNGKPWIAIIALLMVFSLLAFWLYNKFPARIFPGDTLTYTIGALAAAVAIFADIEKLFVIIFIPYVLEFFMKMGGMFKKESFAKAKEDGTLIPRYKKSYGLENLFVKILNQLNIRTTERKVVYCLHLFQLFFIIIAFIL